MPNFPNSTFRVLKFGAGDFSETPANPKHARCGLVVVLKFGESIFRNFCQSNYQLRVLTIGAGVERKCQTHLFFNEYRCSFR